MSPRVYVDSDVIISSLISKTGAAHILVFEAPIVRILSDLSVHELERVVKELHIAKNALSKLLQNKCRIVRLSEKIKRLFKKYSKYCLDPNDAHVVAGAFLTKSPFLITYNMKHYKGEKIKHDLGVIALTPAIFLQYLRSLN